MAKVEVKDAQVVWPGKFDDKGQIRNVSRWNLPLQIIEAVNETRATRESGSLGSQGNLFDVWAGGSMKGASWKNKLIWGDNKYVMSSLLSSLAGKVDLIYIDPPFNTGDDFAHQVTVGDDEIVKEPSAIEVWTYRDTWAKGTSSYLDMMYDRMLLMRELLSPTGSIYVHLDENVSHYVKVMMDEVLGRESYVNEVVWKRTFAHGGAERMGPVHDTILFYSKSDRYTWHPKKIAYSESYRKNFFKFTDPKNGKKYRLTVLTGSGLRGGSSGKPWRGTNPTKIGRHWAIPGYMRSKLGTQPLPDVQAALDKLDEIGRVFWPKKEGGTPLFIQYEDDLEGADIQDVWTDIPPIPPQSKERLGFPTQKPEALLDRIISASSNTGDLVADFFCGAGTTLAVAEKLGRRWIGCDLSRFAIHTTRKRLLDIQDCRPFEILNLGKYERQVWQGLSFAGKQGQSLIYEYLAFILRLYDAQPISGFQSVHGRRGGALVHVGSVDAPVTIGEVMGAVDECISAKQPELHVLGWEWEMGIHDLIETEARKKGVKVLLKQIPSDVMDPQVSKEDVHFFDLAYVQVKATVRRTSVQVELQDFGIPSSDLIRDDVREKIRHWSDLIDYWAVDFDFKNDTFLNSWQAYRTQDNPKLELKSTSHEYEKHGKHQVLVKVVDIFGIDSSKLLEVEV